MRLLLALLLLLPGVARATDIVDATGRTVTIPDHVSRILPAGPPAAVLLVALAPDLMLGFPMDVSPEARAFLSPEAAALPKVPRLTGKQDVTEEIRALKPDLIVDYGDVTPGYADLAQKTQEKLGVPVILLDGALAKTPDAIQVLGKVLHRPLRAGLLATQAKNILTLASLKLTAYAVPRNGQQLPEQDVPAPKPHTVMYVRGMTDLRAVAPDVGASEAFTYLHWQVLAPAGSGSFRPVTLDQIAALDPDEVLFADERMRNVVAASEAWRKLRAVREQQAFIAPARPFGWIEEPPSINRLLGLRWLAFESLYATLGAEPEAITAQATDFGGVVFGHAPTEAQLESLAESAKPLPP